MITNLFLQGPRGIGKSSLLRSVLGEIRDNVGGYFVQRLFRQGEHVGFRMVDVESGEPYCLNNEIGLRSLEDLNNVIVMKTVAGTWQRFPGVFETVGIQIVAGAGRGQKRIVLLDELGDIELEAPGFQQAVLGVLESGKKVIGVLKQSGNPFIRGIKEREDVLTCDLKPATYPVVLAGVRDFIMAEFDQESI
ncbi:MAG: nucleoside-triphosphatase [bacterium]|jgi:nucleoside-triphosphatase